MITDAELREYRAHRARGWPASAAHAWILALREAAKIDWSEALDGWQRAEWTEDGYDVRVRVVPDQEWADTDWLGTVSDDPPTSDPDDWCVKLSRSYRSDGGWFRSEQAREMFAWARTAGGMSASVARDYVREIVESEASMWGRLEYVSVLVTVSRAGVELGRGSITTDLDPDDDNMPHLTSLARDAASDAVAEAREALSRLCAVAS